MSKSQMVRECAALALWRSQVSVQAAAWRVTHASRLMIPLLHSLPAHVHACVVNDTAYAGTGQQVLAMKLL